MSGVDWSSGVFGLAVAEYANELIGLHHVISSTFDKQGATVKTFTHLMFTASEIAQKRIIEWSHDASLKARLAGTIDSYAAEAIALAWAIWRTMPRDLTKLCLNAAFPSQRYAWALEERDPILAFLGTGGSHDVEAYIERRNKADWIISGGDGATITVLR